jgi:hypothetical protein
MVEVGAECGSFAEHPARAMVAATVAVAISASFEILMPFSLFSEDVSAQAAAFLLAVSW